LIRTRSLFFPIAVSVVNLTLTLATEFATIHNFPNSGDEYSYLISAELFSRGKLSVPSPTFPRFFDVYYFINDGRFFGKYPPGWPALLAIGVRTGTPWLVNPLLGVAAILMIYGITRRFASQTAANIACLICLGNPYLIFNSASYYSHPACLVFTLGFFYLLFRCLEDPGQKSAYFWMGLCAGSAFLTRPFTAVVLMAIPTLYLLLQTRFPDRRKEKLFGLGLSALSFGLCMAMFLAYNKAQTGHALKQPFQAYNPIDAPSAPANAADWMWRVEWLLLHRTWDLIHWLPLAPLFLFVALWLRPTRADKRLTLLGLSSISLFLAYFSYKYAGGSSQYGPRYLYEAMGSLTIISAAIIARFEQRSALLVLLVFLLGTLTFITDTRRVHKQIVGKMDVYRCAERQGITNALVFLRTGSGQAPVDECARNGIDFSGPVLYVRDLGAENRLLRREYGGRTWYYYAYDPSASRGGLTLIDQSQMDQ
jgi:hypothetical protein